MTTDLASPGDDEQPSSFQALRLARLKRLQELRAQRDAMVAADPGGTRRTLIEQYPTALDFAERFDMRTRRTPALELIARKLRETGDAKDGRLVISIPPQEGKTTLIRWWITWMLCQNPDRRIVFASFAQSLARQTGREVRNKLRTYPELALPLDQSHRDATDWAIAGKAGGLYSVGVGGALTGRPSDAMIIDDPLRSQADADSDITRANLHEWWEAVARTRLAPGAPALVIQTRWHEDDLAGRLAGQGWPLVNIPAYADGHTEDALDREPGEWLVSARGRTAEDWQAIREDVGPRTFAALYQGRPAPLEGGIFKREWFNTHRLTQRPELDPVAIGVDPADTGKGDAAGILVAGVTPGGQIVFVADESGQLTQAMWARRACIAWIRHGAARIVQEHNLGMRTSIPDAWAQLYRQATAIAAVEDRESKPHDGVVNEASEALRAAGDGLAGNTVALRELVAGDLFQAVLDHGEMGPRVISITPRQSKRVRAESVAGAFETGRAVVLGELKQLEHEACFPAGTPVLTDRGEVSIEQVTTQDRVRTRNGWRAVEWSGQTGVQNLLEVRTADGHVLQATPNHRVWIEGRGWTRLKFVAPGHRMRTRPAPAPASTSPSRAGTTPPTRTATGKPPRLVESGSDSSTATSGLPLMGPSQRGGTSTISTTTSPTTTWGTFAPRLPGTTRGNILDVAGPAGAPILMQQVGGGSGPSVRPLPVCASTAVASSSRPASGPSTAASTAERPTTPSDAVSSPRRATRPSSDAPSTSVVSVEIVSGPPVPVYDLTVAIDHEFYAGGLLVHNCTWQEGQKSPNRIDTLAMLTMHLEAGRSTARIGRVKSNDGGAVIPINTARSAGTGERSVGRGVTPMGMRRAMRGLPQSPHERDA